MYRGEGVQVTGVCVVSQVVQADVDHAGAESSIEVRDVKIHGGVVEEHLRTNVDRPDRVMPGGPEFQPCYVIQEIAVERAPPIEHSSDVAG